jgi:predicted nucleic acid-binding protein
MPEHCFEESVRTLHTRIGERATVSAIDASTADVLRNEGEAALTAAIEVIPPAVYIPREADAQRRLELHCAFDDWPAVALALTLGTKADGIWTDDRDFFGSGVAVWSTDVLRRVLFGASRGVVVTSGPQPPS